LIDFKSIENFKSIGQITGIKVERYENKDDEYMILVATPFRIFQFVGGPNFEEIFEDYKLQKKFKSLEAQYVKKFNFSAADVLLYSSVMKKPATAFAWLSGKL
jgi:hypothetical protein